MSMEEHGECLLYIFFDTDVPEQRLLKIYVASSSFRLIGRNLSQVHS